MATATLPPSSTMCPSASKRASRPATRTADGPISTPRRDCPRSSGTPITRIFLAVIFEEDAVVVVIVSKATHRRERRDRRVWKFIHYSLQAVLQHAIVEVDQKADLRVRNPQIGQQLCVVNRTELLYRFDLNYYRILHQQIHTVSTIQPHVLIKHWQGNLFLRLQ